jgi:hypothetical protein
MISFFASRRAVHTPLVQATQDEAAIGTHSAILAKASLRAPVRRIVQYSVVFLLTHCRRPQ